MVPIYNLLLGPQNQADKVNSGDGSKSVQNVMNASQLSQKRMKDPSGIYTKYPKIQKTPET